MPEQPPPKKTADYPAEVHVDWWRTCVASMADGRAFGPMMAAEAQERGFFQAKRKAFVADGASGNWGIHRRYFAQFGPITDFFYTLCVTFTVRRGRSAAPRGKRWPLYEKWLCACWQGRVQEVIDELKLAQVHVGVPPDDEELDKKDPRQLVAAEGLSYLNNNQSRMDYPRYRREGLPITSSLVESWVGEFNARVKVCSRSFGIARMVRSRFCSCERPCWARTTVSIASSEQSSGLSLSRSQVFDWL